jgi:predicted  nucleic acid-binding Zn-ribbon protein
MENIPLSVVDHEHQQSKLDKLEDHVCTLTSNLDKAKEVILTLSERVDQIMDCLQSLSNLIESDNSQI